MAIDFPNTPTTNQIYTVGSRSWKWDGTIWAIYSNNPVLYRQDSPPSSPQEGDQWFETDTGRMFVYYGTAWVELGNATDVAGALQPSQVTALSAVTTLTSDDVFPVVDGPSGAVASSKITYGNLSTAISNTLGTWTDYTPTWTAGTTNPTLGNGTIAGRYCQIGKIVWVEIILSIGSTTTVGSGQYRFSVPVTKATVLGNYQALGSGYAEDASAAYAYTLFVGDSAGANNYVQMRFTGSIYGEVTNSTPFVPASGDRYTISFTYKAA